MGMLAKANRHLEQKLGGASSSAPEVTTLSTLTGNGDKPQGLCVLDL